MLSQSHESRAEKAGGGGKIRNKSLKSVILQEQDRPQGNHTRSRRRFPFLGPPTFLSISLFRTLGLGRHRGGLLGGIWVEELGAGVEEELAQLVKGRICAHALRVRAAHDMGHH
eukprot:2549861-Rhodomonas_salina.1